MYTCWHSIKAGSWFLGVGCDEAPGDSGEFSVIVGLMVLVVVSHVSANFISDDDYGSVCFWCW